jgi:chemotaxis protein methyltransferase CheR
MRKPVAARVTPFIQPVPSPPAISEQEFRLFQRFIHEAAGIAISSEKKALVERLAPRLQARQLGSYAAYFQLLASGEAPAEVETAVDLLTINETYFFREGKHFDLLRRVASSERSRAEIFRVWSAASSTGEEAYSIAMVLADCLNGLAWEVLGSDISARVLACARIGHYPMQRARHIPEEYLKRFCLKGVGEQEGTLLVQRPLRSRVRFMQVNLNAGLPQLGLFDVIFLRNVLIYFNENTRRQVVERLLTALKPDGYFLIGHAESLHQIGAALERVAPSTYRRSAGRARPAGRE